MPANKENIDKRCVKCGRRLRTYGKLCNRCARIADSIADKTDEFDIEEIVPTDDFLTDESMTNEFVTDNSSTNEFLANESATNEILIDRSMTDEFMTNEIFPDEITADKSSTMVFNLEDNSSEQVKPVETILSERHYIGRNYERYMDIFSSLRDRKLICVWNWSAFLGGPFWMLYRKLYIPAMLMLALCFAAVFPLWPLPLVYLIEGLFAGIFGNTLIKGRICRLIGRGRDLTEPYRSKHIEKKGGVQSKLTWLMLTMLVIAVGIRAWVMLLPPKVSEVKQLCMHEGCYNWAVEDSKYCNDHVCISKGCSNERVAGGQYCEEHQWMNNMCLEPGCQNETIEGGMYCPEHTCIEEGCVAHRAVGSEFCLNHAPDISSDSGE